MLTHSITQCVHIKVSKNVPVVTTVVNLCISGCCVFKLFYWRNKPLFYVFLFSWFKMSTVMKWEHLNRNNLSLKWIVFHLSWIPLTWSLLSVLTQGNWNDISLNKITIIMRSRWSKPVSPISNTYLWSSCNGIHNLLRQV